jgi:hypothetical protein
VSFIVDSDGNCSSQESCVFVPFSIYSCGIWKPPSFPCWSDSNSSLDAPPVLLMEYYHSCQAEIQKCVDHVFGAKIKRKEFIQALLQLFPQVASMIFIV